MSTCPAPLNAGDLILVSPDPLVRGRALARFYFETNLKILNHIHRAATWLNTDEAKSILNDAYLRASESLIAEPDLLSRYRPEIIVIFKAEALTTDYLRYKLTLKRGRKVPFSSIDSYSPPLPDAFVIEPRPPDPWLEA